MLRDKSVCFLMDFLTYLNCLFSLARHISLIQEEKNGIQMKGNKSNQGMFSFKRRKNSKEKTISNLQASLFCVPRDRAIGSATVSTTQKYRISYHSREKTTFFFFLHLIDCWRDFSLFKYLNSVWESVGTLWASKFISISRNLWRAAEMGWFVLLISTGFLCVQLEMQCYRFPNCSFNRNTSWVQRHVYKCKAFICTKSAMFLEIYWDFFLMLVCISVM